MYVHNFILLSDYDVLSKFTLLLLEDSGWYKVNYAALDNLRQNPLQWGKGLGCPFLTERCTNKSVFPYLCDTSETQLVCTYDHLSKVRMYVCTYQCTYVCMYVRTYIRTYVYNITSIIHFVQKVGLDMRIKA